MFENALYYPTIDIHNEAWLKSAALFGDRLETIVPESEENPYRRRSTRYLQDEGILFAHRVNPFSEEVIGLGTCVMTGVIPTIMGMGPDTNTNVVIGVCEGLGLALTSLPYLLKRGDYGSNPYSYLIKMNKELSAFRRN